MQFGKVMPRGVVLSNPEIEDCTPDCLDLEFVTVVCLKTAHADADIPVVFGRPHKCFMVASLENDAQASSILFHLSPLFKTYGVGGLVIVPDGTEAWIPFFTQRTTTNGVVYGRAIFLRQAVSRFYIDVDRPNGAVSNVKITFLGTDDIENISAKFGGGV